MFSFLRSKKKQTQDNHKNEDDKIHNPLFVCVTDTPELPERL